MGSLKGEDHPNSKLSSEEVKTIRKLYSMGFDLKVIARNHKISLWNATSIVKRKTWKHI
jgi:hypothetical protein